MIWRTCASVRSSSARRAYRPEPSDWSIPTRRDPGTAGCRRRRAAREDRGPAWWRCRGTASDRPDQPRDRRMVDARLLGQLALRHLLGLELRSKPFVERSAVLGGHAAWALLEVDCGCKSRSKRCVDATMMGRTASTLYHPFVPVSLPRTRDRRRRVRWGRGRCAAVARRRSPRTKVRPRPMGRIAAP